MSAASCRISRDSFTSCQYVDCTLACVLPYSILQPSGALSSSALRHKLCLQFGRLKNAFSDKKKLLFFYLASLLWIWPQHFISASHFPMYHLLFSPLISLKSLQKALTGLCLLCCHSVLSLLPFLLSALIYKYFFPFGHPFSIP